MTTPNPDYLDVLENIQRDLRSIALDLRRIDLTTEERVQLGALLSAIGKQSDTALGPIKETLRTEALVQIGSPTGTHRFEAPGGASCTVVVPVPAVQVRKDFNMQGLKAVLGDTFPVLFEEVTAYKPREDFQATVAVCQPDCQQAALAAVEVVDRTPKVHFKE